MNKERDEQAYSFRPARWPHYYAALYKLILQYKELIAWRQQKSVTH